ncbi:LOW QUALITY PROTEIN: Serine/threonine protein kinase [Phytophthora megakarya]|uniref:Serine/threonine protein kinase n=1 Tax=Phytophthora megakarya TaxID=4795 RepID=A0A225V826_9STRA|nr:LOW QUALITY PROTEIN: Serine/threonine protein kinase [Phytophthora megakarya]
MVTLFCAIVACCYRYRREQGGGSFEDAVHDEKKYQFAAAESWRRSTSRSEDEEKLKKGEKTALIAALTHEYGELQGEDGLTEVLKDMKQPSTSQVHVLVVLPVGDLALENKWKRKMIDYENYPDAWIKTIKEEHVEELPLICGGLKRVSTTRYNIRFASSPHCVHDGHNGRELSSIWKTLFKPEMRDTFSDTTTGIVRSVIDHGLECAPDIHVSSLVGFSHCNVAEECLPRIGQSCAFTTLVAMCACFAGTKTKVARLPVNELHDKLTWKYDDAPCIFDYAAVGLQVGLVIIRKDKMTEQGAKWKSSKRMV